MIGAMKEDDNIWSALTEPLSSFVGGQPKNRANVKEMTAKTEETEQRRSRKRIQHLQQEVEDVNEEATNTRKMLWEAQDLLKESEDQIRKLENHLNEVLELREKDLHSIKSLRVANCECVENESRAREAMEVFKKCYKRAQVKIKEHEEEIVVLREHRNIAQRGGVEDYNSSGMVNESALEYIQSVSNEKEKKLNKMLSETEVEVDLWKSKYKVANRRCLNWQEQMLAMEHPTEGAAHIKRQRIQIENLESEIKTIQQKEAEEKAQRDCRNPFEGMAQGTTCVDDDARDGCTKNFLEGFQNLTCSIPAM
jgi:hypothetical protein